MGRGGGGTALTGCGGSISSSCLPVRMFKKRLISPPLVAGGAAGCSRGRTAAVDGAAVVGVGEGGKNSLTAAFSDACGTSRANSGKAWASIRIN